MEQALEEEDLKWRQRAKQHWLLHGDRNTQFYHMHANQRRKTNTISHILDHNGMPISDVEQIAVAFSTYYSQLFSTSSPSNFQECLQGMEAKVTTGMNNKLLARFIEKEVKEAMF